MELFNPLGLLMIGHVIVLHTLTAFGEVETTLLALDREIQIRKSLVKAAAAGQRAVKLSSGRYRAGLAGFLDVLQSERAFYLSRDQLVLSEQRIGVYLVALFKALGGGWDVDQAFSTASTDTTVNIKKNVQARHSKEVEQ